MHFWSKNLPKSLPKRGPNPSKIDAENVMFFNIHFLGFWPRFWSLLGLQDGAKLAQNRKKSGLGVVWVWFLSDLKLDIFLKWRLGGLQARFWRPQASLLEGFGTPKLAQDSPKAPKFPATCFLKLRFLPFKFKRQEHRIWHAPSSKSLAKVGMRRCPPLGDCNEIDDAD